MSQTTILVGIGQTLRGIKMTSMREIARVDGGRNTEYRMLHAQVQAQLGKPNICVICNTTEAPRFHWANISGDYKKDLSDWRRLCVRCHKREKHIGYCVQGHKMTKDNTYIRPKGEWECVTCRAHQRKNFKGAITA